MCCLQIIFNNNNNNNNNLQQHEQLKKLSDNFWTLKKKCIWSGIVNSDWKGKKNKDNLSMKYNCVVCVCCIIVNFGTSRTMFS